MPPSLRAALRRAREVKFLDERFRKNPGRYLAQVALALVTIAGVMTFLGVLTQGVVVAALGSSAFVVFAIPHSRTAQPRRLIGGHLVSMAIGIVCSIPFRVGLLGRGDLAIGLLAAAAVTLAILVMVVTNTEHPPAAGNALAFSISHVTWAHVLLILGAVVALAVVRHCLRHWLRDLA